MKPHHGSAAGFQNQLQCKVIGIQPFFDIFKLRIHRIPVVDAESFHNGEGISAVGSGSFLCLADGGNTILGPCQAYFADVVDTFAAFADTVFHQIFNKISGKMKLIVKIEQCLNLRGR